MPELELFVIILAAAHPEPIIVGSTYAKPVFLVYSSDKGIKANRRERKEENRRKPDGEEELEQESWPRFPLVSWARRFQ